MAKQVNKKTLAQMKVMADLGNSPTSISRKLGMSHHTVLKFLTKRTQLFDDPIVKELIDIIRQKELDAQLLDLEAEKKEREGSNE